MAGRYIRKLRAERQSVDLSFHLVGTPSWRWVRQETQCPRHPDPRRIPFPGEETGPNGMGQKVFLGPWELQGQVGSQQGLVALLSRPGEGPGPRLSGAWSI